MFAERYGARYILGFAFATAAILSTLSPVASQYLSLAIAIRFLTGVVMVGHESFTYKAKINLDDWI